MIKETYYFSQTFRMDEMEIQPIFIRYEQLRPIIASHRHSHSSYEIHYTAGGKGSVNIEGITYSVEKGTLYVTGPDISHEQYSDQEDPVMEYCLYLNCQQIKHKKNVKHDFLDTRFWYGNDREDIFKSIFELITEQREQKGDFQEMSEALLRKIIILLKRTYQSTIDIREEQKKSIPVKADHYPLVEDAFFYNHETLRLSDLAQLLHLSERQTQRFLQEHYGKTFSQKLLEARMAAARQKLRDTNLTIEKIAEEIGYSSGEHFSTAFRRTYQQSPGAYRKEHQRSTES